MRADELSFSTILLCIVTFLAFFYMFATDVHADTAESGYTAITTLTDDDEYASWYNGYIPHPPILRQMNGTLWMFDNFVTTPSSVQTIYGHFSTDKGDMWSDIEIIDQDDPGFSVGGYPRNVIDGCILSNNSIIILIELYAYQTTDNLELWMFCHWNNTDLTQWERLPVYVSETYHIATQWGQILVGDDDTVYTYHQRVSNTMYYKSWDLTTRTPTQIFTKYPPYSGNKFWLMIDSTEQLYFAYANGVSPEYLYIYLIPQGTLYASKGGSSSYYWRDCIMTLDDTVVAVVSWSTGGAYDKLWYYNGTGEGYTAIMDTNEVLVYPRLSLCQGDPERIYIFSYNQVADHFAYKAQDYFKGSVAWKASYVEVWEDSEHSVKSFGWPGSRDHFPQVYSDILEETVYTQLPDTGWIFACSDYDTGADDWDHYIIHDSSTTWLGIPWYFGPDPNIATASLDEGTFGTYYTFTLTGEYGETPYIWSILVGPAWLNIGAGNGTIYGDPSGVGNFPVTIRLTETHDAPRSDDAAFSLRINSAVSEGSTGEANSFLFEEMGSLWVLLAVTSVLVGVARSYKMAIYRRNNR